MTYRILSGIPIALLALCVIGFNDYVFVAQMLLRRRAPTWIPVLGGIFGAVAVLLLCPRAAMWWCLLPFIIDWGSLPGIVHALIIHQRASRS